MAQNAVVGGTILKKNRKKRVPRGGVAAGKSSKEEGRSETTGNWLQNYT